MVKNTLRILSKLIIVLLLITGCTSDNKKTMRGVMNLFEGSDYYQNMYPKRTKTTRATTLYQLAGFDSTRAIGRIRKGIDIEILGETSKLHEKRYGRGFYLVRNTRDTNLWTGWIEKMAITDTVEDPNRFFPLSSGKMSFDNKFTVICTGFNGGFKVLTKKGESLRDLPFAKLRDTVAEAYDGGILGWSDNSQYAWADVSVDSQILCFLRIHSGTGSYDILKVPEAFSGHQMVINYNNGNMLYTDYPFQ
jgi:hypothetical protein